MYKHMHNNMLFWSKFTEGSPLEDCHSQLTRWYCLLFTSCRGIPASADKLERDVDSRSTRSPSVNLFIALFVPSQGEAMNSFSCELRMIRNQGWWRICTLVLDVFLRSKLQGVFVSRFKCVVAFHPSLGSFILVFSVWCTIHCTAGRDKLLCVILEFLNLGPISCSWYPFLCCFEPVGIFLCWLKQRLKGGLKPWQGLRIMYHRSFS